MLRSRDMSRDDELTKALHLLIHEVRTPLGIASGYLRLVITHRLATQEDQAAALARSLEALGRISRLCDDASAYVASSPEAGEPGVGVPTLSAAEVAARVCDALGPLALPCAVAEMQGFVRCRPRVDELVSAVATIVGSIRRPSDVGANLSVSVRSDSTRLCFLAGTVAHREALVTDARVPVDPWRGGFGLALPLAYRRIVESGGDVWTTETARPGIGLSLPLEESVS